jgi:hypothetical protein
LPSRILTGASSQYLSEDNFRDIGCVYATSFERLGNGSRSQING